MNFLATYIYCENLRVNQLLTVTFSGVAVAQTRVMALNFMQCNIEFCH